MINNFALNDLDCTTFTFNIFMKVVFIIYKSESFDEIKEGIISKFDYNFWRQQVSVWA